MPQAVNAALGVRTPPRQGIISSVVRFTKDKPLGAIAGAVFLIMLLVAIAGPWVTPQDPLTQNLVGRLKAPSLDHWMGTDHLGRDIFSRLIAGTRIALLVGVVSSFLGSTVGALFGVASGYVGGRFDMTLQRIMDMIMTFPGLILAIAIMAVLGGSVFNVIMAIAIPMVPRANRVVRSLAVSIKQNQYIEAARAVGVSRTRIIFRHMLPNCMAAYLIILTSALGGSILAEASLSFLGLGVPPPHPSWGRSLNEAMPFLYGYPWLSIFPGVAISLAVFGANLFGDALRDMWDPRLRRL